MQKKEFPYPSSLDIFRNQILHWLKNFDTFCYLDSCDFGNIDSETIPPYYHKYDLLIGAGDLDHIKSEQGNAFDKLKSFYEQNESWLFGHFGYDLKNELENLTSQNSDQQQSTDLHFFRPAIVLAITARGIEIQAEDQNTIQNAWQTIQDCPEHLDDQPLHIKAPLSQRTSKEAYKSVVQAIIDHIIEGDVYELNYCQEFFSEDVELDPFILYRDLQKTAPSPFSCFYKTGEHYLVSASMERFLRKENEKLTSQPIKGTIRRGKSETEDQELGNELLNDPKERAENVMIVDLVRNDLAKSALAGTVEVEELFGIYPFPAVHQMISTVSATKSPETHVIDAIKHAFPMGSMTGAPKVKAMELIEKYENFKRGLFSGAVGYITPDGDFDFNVVIRSFLYNEAQKYLSIPVGSAITYEAKPAKEYEECLTKIKGLTQALSDNPLLS